MQPSFTTFISTVSQYDLGMRSKVTGHQAQPLIACGLAVGFGEHQPVMFACLDTQCQCQFFTADIPGAVRSETVIQVLVFFFKSGQYGFAFIRRAVIDDDYFKLRIILFQDSRKETAQIF